MRILKFSVFIILFGIIIIISSNCKKETIYETIRDSVTVIKDTTIIIKDTTVIIKDPTIVIRDSIIIRDTVIIIKPDSIIIGDKNILFTLLEGNLWGAGYTDKSKDIMTPLKSFSIMDYKYVDSISFVISNLSIYNSNSNIITTNSLSLELVDFTNNSVIEKSKIETTGTTKYGIIASKNLLNSFPKNRINLGIRATFDNSNGAYWNLEHASLVLVRK